MLYSFASLSSSQVCMQCIVQLLLYLTASNWTQCVTHYLLHFFAFKGGLNMPCHFSFHYVWLPFTCCILLLHPICLCTFVDPSWCVCDRLMHRQGMWSCVWSWRQEVTLWLSLRQWRGRTCWWRWTEARLLLWARRPSVISCWSYRWKYLGICMALPSVHWS